MKRYNKYTVVPETVIENYLIQQVENLEAGGSTNMESGMRLVHEMFSEPGKQTI